MIGSDVLENRFSHHPPSTDEVVGLHQDARAEALRLALWVDANVPDCREKSTAITKIEEAMFWINAGIAREANVLEV